MATKGKAQGKSRNGARTILFALVGPIVLYYLHPTVVFLFFAMLPTFAALIAERRGSYHAWIAVGGLNFTGAAPFLLELWSGGHTMAGVGQLLSITTLMIMYGAPLLGGVLFFVIPLVVGVFLTITASHPRGHAENAAAPSYGPVGSRTGPGGRQGEEKQGDR